MQKWGRLLTAMATPFKPDGEMNIKGAQELAKKLASEGSSALVIAGTTGESPTLSDEEKLELFAALKEAVTIPIIANVGSNNTMNSVKFTAKAKEVGVDGVMAVVPYYNKPNEEGLLAHFTAIAEAAELPVMVYNVPGRTGIDLNADILLKLAKIPNICCLKEATGDFTKISRLVKEAPGFSVYTGEDLLTLPVLAVGAYGVVSVAAHVAGKQMKAMIDAYLAGHVIEAHKLHASLLPVYQTLFLTSNPIPLKAALKLQGFDAGGVRLPLVDANEELKEKLVNVLNALPN